MDELQAEKEELDRRRKLLQKRKPTDKSNARRTATSSATALLAAGGAPQQNEAADATATGSVNAFGGPLSAVTSNTANGAANWAPTDFIQPEAKEYVASVFCQLETAISIAILYSKKAIRVRCDHFPYLVWSDAVWSKAEETGCLSVALQMDLVRLLPRRRNPETANSSAEEGRAGLSR